MLQNRLKALREARGLSQIQLAEKLGLSGGGIGGYENGSRIPKPAILALLAEFFGVPVPDLEYGPQLTPDQYEAFCARLSDALDHTSSDDFEALGLSERAIRAAIRQRTPIREDRAVELAQILGTRISDILDIKPAPSGALAELEDLLKTAPESQIRELIAYYKFRFPEAGHGNS